MFLISVVLSVGLTSIFAVPYFPNFNGGNPRFVPQQEPSTTQKDQDYAPSIPQLSMEGNQPIYPMPQQPMMQQPMMQLPMMQGFQPPFGFNPITPQPVPLLMMSAYARMMALLQLMSMQNRYQLYQPNQFNDPAINNYGPTPAPMSYTQQPQVDLQNNLQSEMLQQQKQAESQQQAILEERKVQREYDMEIERREKLIKRKAEEEELEKQQKQLERQLLDEEEIKREMEEAKKQILEEERKEMEQKEKDLKLRQEEELRFKKIEEEKKKQNQKNMKSKVRVNRVQRQPINQ